MATEKSMTEEDLEKLDPQSLYSLLLEKEMGFAKASLELQRRRGQKRIHVRAEDAPLLDWDTGNHAVSAPELGFDIYTFSVSVVHVPPGQERAQTQGDAMNYYLTGKGYEIIGDQRFEIKAGDFIHIPANTWHATHNPNDEPIRFITWQQYLGTFRQVSTPFIISD